MRGSKPKMDKCAVSLPHASPGSTGSSRPFNPLAASPELLSSVLSQQSRATAASSRCLLCHQASSRRQPAGASGRSAALSWCRQGRLSKQKLGEFGKAIDCAEICLASFKGAFRASCSACCSILQHSPICNAADAQNIDHTSSDMDVHLPTGSNI